MLDTAPDNDRPPLFPGNHSDGLSPANKRFTRTSMDQLEVIFQVLGFPGEAVLRDMGAPISAIERLEKLTYEGNAFEDRFVHAKDANGDQSQDVIGILKQMLTINPKHRPSVADLQTHPFLSVHAEAAAGCSRATPSSIDFHFEKDIQRLEEQKKGSSVKFIRKEMVEEAKWFAAVWENS